MIEALHLSAQAKRVLGPMGYLVFFSPAVLGNGQTVQLSKGAFPWRTRYPLS